MVMPYLLSLITRVLHCDFCKVSFFKAKLPFKTNKFDIKEHVCKHKSIHYSRDTFNKISMKLSNKDKKFKTKDWSHETNLTHDI